MANHFAIATVTEALRRRLVKDLSEEFSDDIVEARRPDATDQPSKRLLTLFLYRITPNAALRNTDLPTRTSDGKAVRTRPRAALNLHYLLSFAGDEAQLEPQRMLGLVVASLHSRPCLGPGDLTAAADDEDWFVPDTIANDIESVKFYLEPMTLDDLSKMWSVFFQLPYRLSVSYEASVVLIESDLTVIEPHRVQRPGVDALPIRQPEVEQVRARWHRDAQGNPTGTLDIDVTGKLLRGPLTLVQFDRDDPIPATPRGDTRLAVSDIPLGAGVHGVRVIHQVEIGFPPSPHRAVESNLAAFVVRPAITNAVFVADAADPARNAIVIALLPPIQKDQNVRLLLNQIAIPPPQDALGYVLEPETELVAGTSTVRFRTANVDAGTYLVRVQVDGAESLIDTHAGQTPQPPPSPQVTVP